MASEAAADGTFGEHAGPESYRTCFHDAVAGLRDISLATPADRIELAVRDDR